MTRDDFLRKHGPIRIAEEVDRHFARLRQPHFENGAWEKIDRKGPKILDGRFYSIGYFPEGEDPAAMEHPWEALDASLTFAAELAGLLRAAGCTTLESEGDAPYFPFVSSTCVTQRELDFDRLGVSLPQALRSAYSKGDLHESYSTDIDIAYATNRACLFWPNGREEDYASDLRPEEYRAYRQVSDRMRAELEEPWAVTLYSDFIEFPVLYGGVNIHEHFVGVLTSRVWT